MDLYAKDGTFIYTISNNVAAWLTARLPLGSLVIKQHSSENDMVSHTAFFQFLMRLLFLHSWSPFFMTTVPKKDYPFLRELEVFTNGVLTLCESSGKVILNDYVSNIEAFVQCAGELVTGYERSVTEPANPYQTCVAKYLSPKFSAQYELTMKKRISDAVKQSLTTGKPQHIKISNFLKDSDSTTIYLSCDHSHIDDTIMSHCYDSQLTDAVREYDSTCPYRWFIIEFLDTVVRRDAGEQIPPVGCLNAMSESRLTAYVVNYTKGYV